MDLRAARHRAAHFPGEVYLAGLATWWSIASVIGGTAARGTALDRVKDLWDPGAPVLTIVLILLAACSWCSFLDGYCARLYTLVAHAMVWTFIGILVATSAPFGTATGTYLLAGLVLAPLCAFRLQHSNGEE